MLWQARKADPVRDEDRQSLDESIEAVEDLLARVQVVSGAERVIERDLFDSPDQRENLFVRLLLRDTRHTLAVGDSSIDVIFEPRLLLHRDGVFQLTVGVFPAGQLSVEDLIATAYPTNEYITTSVVPAPLLGDQAHGPGVWGPDEEEGVRVRLIDHDEPATILDWVDMVRTRVLGLIRADPRGPWNCYPMVLTAPGACCSDWMSSHEQDIASLATRWDGDSATLRVDFGPDFSVDTDSRWYVSLASSLRVHQPGWEPAITDLHNTLLFEHTLLLYTRWRALENEVAQLRADGPQLTKLYRQSLALAREARGASIRSGSARDIAAHLLSELGGPRIDHVIERALTMLGEQSSTRSAARAARAANWIATIGAAVGVLAAIPSIPAILGLIAEEHAARPDAPGWSIIHTLATSPLLLAATVLSAGATYLAGTVVTVAVRIIRYIARQRRRGYASRLTIDYQLSEKWAPNPNSTERDDGNSTTSRSF